MTDQKLQVVKTAWPGEWQRTGDSAVLFLGGFWGVRACVWQAAESWYLDVVFNERATTIARGPDLAEVVGRAREVLRGHLLAMLARVDWRPPLGLPPEQMMGAPGVDDGLVSLEEAAAMLGMTKQAVLAAERDGQFLWGFVERLGWGFVDPGSCRFYREDVERYKAQRSVKRGEALEELAELWADVPELTPPE